MSSGLFKQEEALLGKAKEGEAALDAEQYKVLLKGYEKLLKQTYWPHSAQNKLPKPTHTRRT